MKQLNLVFEDKEHKILTQAKEKHGGNWHDFVLDLSRDYIKKGGENDS